MTVKELFEKKYDNKYADRIFWYASSVVFDNNNINIYVDNDNLVTFDYMDLPLKKISEIRTFKKSSKILHNVLVASGSFLFINNKLLTTQRNYETIYDPGFWTTPAGRCDGNIMQTGIKETIEEIHIHSDDKILYPSIAKNLVVDDPNITYYKTSFEDKNIDLKIYNISLFLDNVLIEESQAWMYFSEKVHTIEFRIPLFAQLDESKLEFSNPEFGTKTGLKDISELNQLNVVPALKKLIKEIYNVK